MTPCEKLEYKVGDKFTVIQTGVWFDLGETIILQEDDGTDIPGFVREMGQTSLFVRLDSIEKVKESTEEGLKFDIGKSRMDLCDSSFLLGIGEILGFGAEKYGENNWQGVSKARYFAACLRHVLALMGGQTHDEESGRHHALHATCCLMFIFWKDNNDSPNIESS